MNLLKSSWIYILLMLFLFSNLEASQLILSKRENGNNRCPIDSIVYFSRGADKKYEIGFRVNIKNVPPTIDQGCSFPWIIKAFVGNQILAISEEIRYEHFFMNNTDDRLLSVEALITLHQEDLYQFNKPCFTNECDDLLTSLTISFALFSENVEIAPNCYWFDDPSLTPNSTKTEEIFHFMGCLKQIKNSTPIGITEKNTKELRSSFHKTAKENSERVHINPNARFDRDRGSTNDSVTTYPNPTNGFMNLRLKGSFNSLCFMELITLNGVSIGTFELQGTHSMINLLKYPPGIYTLKIVTRDFVTTRRVVLK